MECYIFEPTREMRVNLFSDRGIFLICSRKTSQVNSIKRKHKFSKD